ncbi:Putative ATP-dependent RNA helicase ddx17 [Durusdinium trenchii]|uniref:ATP-dependent RNA helicase ddx17 n=1 Tax=Durusdinium trenchii TaxID=1381693 RepID=A0ABP0RP72_9DINO
MEDSFPCAAPGCESTGSKLCSRCGKAAYCSAECQRKDWKVHKLQCQKAETPENRISDHLAKGQLFSAQEALQQLEKPNARLAAELEEKLKLGILSEVIADRLSLQPARYGLGYVAAKDLSAGDPLLFDTAFCSAPMDGDQEFYCTIAEKSIRKGHADRRASARVDAQADFYYDSLLKLCTKDSHDRATLEGTEMEADTREQILVCSIAEANSLYCTEEPNFAALYAAGARFNHSCAPNASIESSRSRLLVRAATAIPKGMEVTISYLPPQLLSEAVGFAVGVVVAAQRTHQWRLAPDRSEASEIRRRATPPP